MRKFIYSILGYSALISIIYLCLRVNNEAGQKNDFVASIIDKHDRLDHIKGNKIIFSGGSNLAFGLNSEAIEKDLHVPVVNLGLYAGFGLSFMLNELKYTIKKGDVVFLSIEYFLDTKGIYTAKKCAGSFLIEANKYYPFDMIEEMNMDMEKTKNNLKNIINHLSIDKNQTETKTEKTNDNVAINATQEINIYSRQAFNKYGDDTAHLHKKQPPQLSKTGLFTYSYWNGIDELNEFYVFAKTLGVDVYYVYPSLCASEYSLSKDAINKLSNDLSNNLKIPIVNKPSDLIYPDSLFFDSEYHLNIIGREKRTKYILDLIRENKTVQLSISNIR